MCICSKTKINIEVLVPFDVVSILRLSVNVCT